MKPFERLVDVVALAAVAILASACTAATSDDALRGQVGSGRSQQGRQQPAPVPRPSRVVASAVKPSDRVQPASVAQTELRPPRIAVAIADQLRLYLLSEFGTPGSEASWYRRIRRVAVGLQTATVHTDLTSDIGDRAASLAICRAVLSFPFSDEGRGVTSLDIEVLGRTGHVLASESYEPPRPSARTRSRVTPIPVPPPQPTCRPERGDAFGRAAI